MCKAPQKHTADRDPRLLVLTLLVHRKMKCGPAPI